MPEGDTIHRLARALRPVLAGRSIVTLRLRERGLLKGMAGLGIREVEARGKHLLIHLDQGWTFRTHLGMYGDVHLYGPRERWKRSRAGAVLTIETSERAVVWFEPARAELLRTAHLPAHPLLSRLGPDLLAPEVDLDEVVRRARSGDPARSVGELLLDQTVACGIGNIYKNEVLFLGRLDPWTPVAGIDDETLRGLYVLARQLLLRNVGPGPRSTRSGLGPNRALLPGEPQMWVYGREHQRCLRCGAAIEVALQGDGARVTFTCPRCQPSAPAGRRKTV